MPSSTSKGMPTAMEMRRELRGAVRCLTERGITKAAKWAAEQLCGLPENLDGSENDEGHELGLLGGEEPPASDRYLLAKTYFDLREYKRAASTLEHECDAKSTFLRCYAKYLAGERAREEQTLEGEGEPKNEELEGIEREIKACDRPDSFLLYLQGLVLLDKERKSEAKEALVRSVRSYPCNWAAWQALQEVQDADGCAAEGSLPDHWMSNFFAAAVCLENGDENERGLEEYTRLQHLFPKSEYVLAQAATAHYNLRQFDEAQDLFESLHRRSPHRIESMDTYSNILYVKEAYAGLSHLAHSAILTDKYKPETCCIIGNYYSLRTQHEKAVAYFRRALKLNRNYLSAWTLMGHEYVEMKNPEAAIEAYRRAVDINPRDYRAWYGLGQTYEVLRMPYYALYYFRQVRPLNHLDPLLSSKLTRFSLSPNEKRPPSSGQGTRGSGARWASATRARSSTCRTPRCSATRTPRARVTVRASPWPRLLTCTGSAGTTRPLTPTTRGT